MTEFFADYGLFLAKAITIVVAIVVIIAVVARSTRRDRHPPETLEVTSLNARYEHLGQVLKHATLSKPEYKKVAKEYKAQKKREARQHKRGEAEQRKRVFVLDFQGDIRATAVASLREEITAVLTEAGDGDEVLVRLENSGGLVHEHGLAASQLARVRQRNIPLTVAVDKVAASGGYLMACVADRILAAPFAIVGSIGVLAQLPNFHRLLEQHGVEFEQIKAGDYKRTVTMFGKNTDADRAKMQEQLEETHGLFKDFITEYRPDVDVASVATGEYWLARQALEKKLVDELVTSDDYLMSARDTADLYQVRYTPRKKLSERVLSSMQRGLEKTFNL